MRLARFSTQRLAALIHGAIPLALGLLSAAPTFAQDPEWSLLRPSNSGIPGEEIRCLGFHPDGKLWVGARWIFWQEGGFGIYDLGSDVWTNYSNFETPIPSEYLNDVAFGADGSVWIATDNGLVHKQGDAWTVYSTANAPLLHNIILDVELDSQGHVWMNNTNVQHQSAALFEFDGVNWRRFSVPTDIPWEDPWRQLHGLLVDRNDHVWVGNMSLPGVAEYDGQSWILRGQNIDLLVPHAADQANGVWLVTGYLGYDAYRWNGTSFVRFGGGTPPLSTTTITKIAVDKSGSLFIGNWMGEVAKSTNQGLTWSPFRVVTARVTGFAFDPASTEVWIGSAGAVHRCNALGQLLHVYNSFNTGIQDFWIDRMMPDRDGFFWTATGEGGLSRFDGFRWRNWGAHNAASEPYPFEGNEPMGCAYQDRNGVHWFGGNGIARWDSQTGQFTGFWNWENNQGMGVGLWTYFAEDASDRLFSADKYGSIFRFDPTGQRWVLEPIQPYAPMGLPGMQADGQGNVWVAGWFDVYRWDGSGWSTISLPNPNYFFDLGGISCMDIGPDGVFWFGTAEGIVRWDGVTFALFNGTNTPLPANYVSGVDVRGNGLLAIAAGDDANHSGVSLIDGDPSEAGNWTVYRYGSSPLAHWQVGQIAFDTDGDLWISCLSMGVVILRVGLDPAGIADLPPPESIRFMPAAPNPFGGRTALRYAVPQEGSIALDIFDAQGRRVQSLVRGTKSRGEYAATWNGLDDRGRIVPRGIYFGRLRSAGGDATIRLVKTD
jgi:ligand-binding sensor domain-containing protein